MSETREDVPVPTAGPSEEGRWHSYVGHQIPWYVRLIWVFFWVFAIYYTISYLFPALRVEIATPP